LLEFAQNGKYVAEPTDLNDLVQRTGQECSAAPKRDRYRV